MLRQKAQRDAVARSAADWLKCWPHATTTAPLQAPAGSPRKARVHLMGQRHGTPIASHELGAALERGEALWARHWKENPG